MISLSSLPAAQLSQVVARLDKKQATLRDYDERIAQTEQAYMKVVGYSALALSVTIHVLGCAGRAAPGRM